MTWSATMSWQDAQEKSKILNRIRRFFESRNVIEVETPLLCKSTITDIHLDPFSTTFSYGPNTHNLPVDLFLQTSPEYCMKRLLASGYDSIYQISKAFRHEPMGRFHNPEFTILEWYQIGYSQHELMQEVEQLLKLILRCDDAIYVTYQNVFIDNTGIDPLDTTISELVNYIEEVGKISDWLLKENKLEVFLQFVLSEIIEPKIGLSTPCFIYDFPIAQASLAKPSDIDPRVSERFECYFKGIELVNGFSELTDFTEQENRFLKDNIERKEMGLEEREIDQRFIAALKSGLPECAGVALGVDRLLMLALKKSSIEEVMTFTVDRA